ncbi:MAG TPA: ribosome biogenesis GTP-binding protein YihA/YsxC [bacterium]|mgnify:FL=1|jgi:GTP-binding protein|nr:YihA family ribosome biogenesis GTP-binding protein [bacterium]MDX9805503.1 ribosome biogenesis GTP-binding protein YihA/YsxC [bacterium]HNW15431.1 ribosome biogenesis GTP-binding protein YihA/YsxC [bacterium]HNZ54393.1 ribosome biogenesis GTP-binding protein YihA/YsxC [bacterium]HOG44304.1 ribosome biogenesis GTP-binding protein YihA/YsxC [bacterium]
MIIKTVSFIKSASSVQNLPSTGLPEFAFIGRSNVGKSSLMNMLMGRKNLVKTSKKPGKTALLNYFIINDLLYFVDLPGYGFASRSKSELDSWRSMIEEYLLKRTELLEIFLLIDSRHGIMANDEQMMTFLEHHRLNYTPVFTKTDKINKTELNVLKQKNRDSFFCSAVKGDGRELLLDHIEKIIGKKE